jgi:hypothetical protein
MTKPKDFSGYVYVILIFFIFLICLALGVAIRVIEISPFNSNFCESVYGPTFIYADSIDVPHNYFKCVALMEDGKLIEKFNTISQLEAICDVPGFFEFSKWGVKCPDYYGQFEEPVLECVDRCLEVCER